MDDRSHPGSSAERRTTPRYNCVGDAEIVVPGRGLRYGGRIANLSVGGCFIETVCRLERGTCVEVWMSTDGLPLRVAANLMDRYDNGVGFRFTDLTPRKTEQIRMLIADLEAGGGMSARSPGAVENQARRGQSSPIVVTRTSLRG